MPLVRIYNNMTIVVIIIYLPRQEVEYSQSKLPRAYLTGRGQIRLGSWTWARQKTASRQPNSKPLTFSKIKTSQRKVSSNMTIAVMMD